MSNSEFLNFRKKFRAYDEAIYINHAAISPWSSITREVLENCWETRSRMPVDVFPAIENTIAEFKENIAGMVHAQSPDQIAFVSNTGTGLNIIAAGMRWNPGDRIILQSREFPSNVYPFMNLHKKDVAIDWIEPEGGIVRPEDIENAISAKTRLLSISLVQFLTGYRADMEAIGSICKKHGVRFIVDGIQGTGVVPVDVQKYHIDAFSSAGHKWLMWPLGSGFLYVNDSLNAEIDPPFAGWLSVKNAWELTDYNLDFKEGAARFEPGTWNYTGLEIARKMVSEFTRLGFENIHARICQLTDILLAGIREAGLQPVTPPQKANRSGIISFRGENPERLMLKLKAKNVICAQREGLVRFSPHCTNTPEEMEEVIRILKTLV